MPDKKPRVYRMKVTLEIEVEFSRPMNMTVKSRANQEVAAIKAHIPAPLVVTEAKNTVPARVGSAPGDSEEVERIEIWTDGGCWPNPGPGGWGLHAVLPGGKIVEKNGFGGEGTTNNRMELQAAIEALKMIPESEFGVVYTDSKYVRDGITLWVKNWKKNHWRTYQKKPVKNRDLWQELDELKCKRHVHWQWVKGHVGIHGNERADALASEAMQGKVLPT